MSQIELLKAYYLLEGMKANIPNKDSVENNYVNDYHSILGILEKITKIDLSEFRVSSEMVKPYQWQSGEITNTQYCPRPVLMMKVDAVLMFFRFLTDNAGKKQIGFSLD